MLYQAISRRETTFSHFYDPMKKAELIAYYQKESPDISLRAFGGFVDAERTMIAFESVYDPIEIADFPMMVLEISYKPMASQLGHKDFLGAILALGIKRDNIGDIIILKQQAQVYLHNNMAEFIDISLHQVGRTSVETQILPISAVSPPLAIPVVKEVTLASLRLDAVIGEGFSMSRGKATSLISSQRVFVNWVPMVNKAKAIDIGDMITVRGMGRLEVVEIMGKSKKNRLFIKLHIFK